MTTIAKLKAALAALENCVAFIDDAHIIEGQWDWKPVETCQASITDLRSVIAEMEAGEYVVGTKTWMEDGKLITKSLTARDIYAQPKAEPADWRDHVEQRILTWRQSTMNRSGDRLALDDFMGKDSIDDLVDFVCSEYAGPVAQPKAEPYDDLVGALAEVRDLFPIPGHGSSIEREWASAMADPCSVPDYVRACIAQPKAEPVQEPCGCPPQGHCGAGSRCQDAPAQEPVAIVVRQGATVRLDWASVGAAHNAQPGMLYAAAPQAKPLVPLTDRQIVEIMRDKMGTITLSYDVELVRAVEAAHGITTHLPADVEGGVV